MEDKVGALSEEQPSRRRFFARLFWSAMGLVGLGIGVPVIGYFLSPVFRRQRKSRVDLGEVGSLALDAPQRVEFAIRQRDGWITRTARAIAWVVRHKDQVVVFDPHCTHLGCPYHWDKQSGRFFCPCHGGVFDVDGCVLAGPPPRPLDVYPSTVRNGRLYVTLSPLRQTEAEVRRCVQRRAPQA